MYFIMVIWQWWHIRQLVGLTVMATVWDNLRMALEWVCSDLIIIINRKGAIMGGWQPRIHRNEKGSSKQTDKNTKQDSDTSLGLTSWAEAIYYLRSSICSKGLWSTVYIWRSAASRVSWRILGLKSSIGIGFQLCQFWTLVVMYVLNNWLPGVSLLYLLLIVPNKVPYSEVKEWVSSDVSSDRQNLMVEDHKEII